jgi:hypothetical protein
MARLTPEQIARLEQAQNIWLATVRPNGTPHLVPIWFAWVNDCAYICTARDSVKARNLLSNPNAAFSLEDGNSPLVAQAQAELLDHAPPEVIGAFIKKFSWNIEGDSTYNTVIRLTPTRWVL